MSNRRLSHRMDRFFRMLFTVIKLSLPELTRDADIYACAHYRQFARAQTRERYTHIGLDPKVADLSETLFESRTQVDNGKRVLRGFMKIPGAVVLAGAAGPFETIRIF